MERAIVAAQRRFERAERVSKWRFHAQAIEVAHLNAVRNVLQDDQLPLRSEEQQSTRRDRMLDIPDANVLAVSHCDSRVNNSSGDISRDTV
jgi:hypothetical protein